VDAEYEVSRKELQERAGRSVVPMLLLPPKRPARHLGCGVLFKIDAHRFVLTAAHVIDAFDRQPIHLGGDGTTVGVAGRIITNVAALRSRDLDPIDIAVIRLTEDFIEPPGTRFLSLADLNTRSWMRPDPNCYVFGYSHAKTKVNAPARELRGESTRIETVRERVEILNDAAYSDDLNIAFALDRDAMDNATGRTVKMPKPDGMSGCAIWSYDADAPLFASDARLVGIFTEYRHSARMGVGSNVGCHLQLLRTKWPEFSDLIPSSVASLRFEITD
jgi:hypothetical protein